MAVAHIAPQLHCLAEENSLNLGTSKSLHVLVHVMENMVELQGSGSRKTQVLIQQCKQCGWGVGGGVAESGLYM